MPGRDPTLANMLPGSIWQVQQAQGVRNVDTAFANILRKGVLRATKSLDQRPVGFGFFNWIEVCSLHILNNPTSNSSSSSTFRTRAGISVKPACLAARQRRSPRDNLVPPMRVGIRSQQDRLKDSALAY